HTARGYPRSAATGSSGSKLPLDCVTDCCADQVDLVVGDAQRRHQHDHVSEGANPDASVGSVAADIATAHFGRRKSSPGLAVFDQLDSHHHTPLANVPNA